MTTSRGLLLVMADIEPAAEQDFNGWYEQEHLIERMALPGVLRARRFRALEGSPNTHSSEIHAQCLCIDL